MLYKYNFAKGFDSVHREPPRIEKQVENRYSDETNCRHTINKGGIKAVRLISV